MTCNESKQPQGLVMEVWELADLVLKNRFKAALESGEPGYPIFRDLRFAARVELEALLDAVALDRSWRAERINGESMILDGDGLFVAAYGSRKSTYCSCVFYVWASDIARAEAAIQRILDKAGATRITEPSFQIDWTFLTARGELESASIEEMATDVLHDQAYPEIKGGVRGFVARFLEAPETVLVLQGPPGTGKTRLIRAILGEISRRRNGKARALYTGDVKALASDEIFVRFITGRADAFVVEDADHLLKPRADGNEHLHRFLAIADGVVRAQGRKIIFSTNLPNVGDLDDALVRPGRCFARVDVRALTSTEARALAASLAGSDADKAARVEHVIGGKPSGKCSVAEVYKALV